MSREQTTPGPWVIGYGGMEGDGFASILSPHRYKPIAELAASKAISDGELRANARLITAAPDMLAALEAIAMWLPKTDNCRADERVIRNKVRAAIAKAKGERCGEGMKTKGDGK